MTRAAGRRRPTAAEDLDLVELLLIDGDNLLHAVRGSRDATGVAWLLPRLRAWRPPDVRIVVALDGAADHGLGDRRPIAPGISVRHAGSRSADDLIVSIVEGRPYAERSRTLVVTDDGRLRERVRRAGGLGRRLAWLTGRMAGAASDPRLAGPTATGGVRPVSGGAGTSPRRPGAPGGVTAGRPGDDADEPAAWRPGRGATRKRGNPKRRPRGGRDGPALGRGRT